MHTASACARESRQMVSLGSRGSIASLGRGDGDCSVCLRRPRQRATSTLDKSRERVRAMTFLVRLMPHDGPDDVGENTSEASDAHTEWTARMDFHGSHGDNRRAI